MAEEAFGQGVRVLSSVSEPPGNRGLSKAKDPLGGGRVEPFGQSREHHSNLLGRGFQPIQGGVASGTERAVARLAAKGLDRLSTPMLAIPNECMPVCVCDPEVQTLLIWTGEAFGGYPDGELRGGFSPHSRVVQEQVLALQSTTQGRPGDRRGNHLGRGA